jgi:phage-related protein
MTSDLSAGADPILIRADVDDDADRMLRRLTSSLGSLGRTAGSVIGRVAGVVAGIAALGAAGAAAIPVVVSVVAAVQSIVPAATAAVTGLLAIKLASGTVKLAMVGMGDAIETALDPKATPEELAESLKGLAPNAREFVKELQSMRGELRKLQQGVQNRFFDGFADTLERLSDAVMPDLRRALNSTADSFNRAGREAGSTAAELGERGVLGQALDSATKSLRSMEKIPAQVVASLGLLAAAGGPTLERFAERVSGVFDRISERVATAFETGELERDVEGAVDVIQQLGRIADNVFGGIKNVVGGVTEETGSLFFILEELSEAFERLTASKEFQSILREVVTTAGDLVDNILPLLKEAFVQLEPVIAELGPPLRDFINKVGPELLPVIKELGPVLLDLAVIFREQLPFAIKVVQTVLQILAVVLRALHWVLQNLIIPIVTKVSEVMNSKYVTAIAAMSRATAERIGSVLSSFERFRRSVADAVRGAVDRLRGFGVDMANFVGRIASSIGSAISIFRGTPGRIRAALGRAGALLYTTGRDIVSGLINGITSRMGGLLATVSNMAASIRKKVKDVLIIFSPSRVMAELGKDTVQGMIVGIKATVPDLENAAAAMARAIPRTASSLADFPQAGAGAFRIMTPEPAEMAVNVFIGSDRLDQRIDYRVRKDGQRRIRDDAQGWRY